MNSNSNHCLQKTKTSPSKALAISWNSVGSTILCNILVRKINFSNRFYRSKFFEQTYRSKLYLTKFNEQIFRSNISNKYSMLTDLSCLPFAEDVNQISSGFQGRNGSKVRRAGVPEIQYKQWLLLQWNPLNGITLRQRQTDSNNQLIVISKLTLK